MSDVRVGPGWWQASDGEWYPPEQAPALPPPPVVVPARRTGASRKGLIVVAVIVALVIVVALARSAPGPSTSFKDGFYWAQNHGAPGNGVFDDPSYISNTKVCSEYVTDAIPSSDDSDQWESGCVSASQGGTLP